MNELWYKCWQTNKILSVGILIHLALLLIVLIILPYDGRQLMGESVWIKSIKFCLSIVLFLASSIFILKYANYKWQSIKIISWVLLSCMLFEIACILLQSARAEKSHFNNTDPLGMMLFPLMGTAITIILVIYIVLCVRYFIYPSKALSTLMLWSVRVGLVIFVFSGVTGFMMASIGRHTIGGVDGGPGWFFTNWSTVAGDLRVAHFMSIHAIQIFPLLGLLLINVSWSTVIKKTVLIMIGLFYTLFNVLAFIQALQGRPLIYL
ncbi:MAG: hypothetical protein ABJH05_07645 [Fulvivirga sp.]